MGFSVTSHSPAQITALQRGDTGFAFSTRWGASSAWLGCPVAGQSDCSQDSAWQSGVWLLLVSPEAELPGLNLGFIVFKLQVFE